jgi:zinc-binding alcohol dehydrogenase family protein
MKAIGYRVSKPILADDSLLDFEVDISAPGPRDLRVAVRAVSVNPVDIKQRLNTAPPQGHTRILGFDAAGVVDAVGEEVTLFKPGDEVFYSGALNRPGTNSELHLVDERIVGRKPKTLNFTQAAALPLTSITAWELMFDRLGVPLGRKTRGGTLLIVNGAGGVGSILTQLARRLTGLDVVATASRAETIAWCRKMGAHHVIDHRRPLNEALKEIGITSVEYVASLSATDQHLPAILDVIAPQGHLALIDDPQTLNILPFKRKSVSVHWEFMFTRSLFQTADMNEQHRLLNEVADLVDDGLIATTLTKEGGTIDATHLKQAHALIESGRSYGKVVLTGF